MNRAARFVSSSGFAGFWVAVALAMIGAHLAIWWTR